MFPDLNLEAWESYTFNPNFFLIWIFSKKLSNFMDVFIFRVFMDSVDFQILHDEAGRGAQSGDMSSVMRAHLTINAISVDWRSLFTHKNFRAQFVVIRGGSSFTPATQPC